MRPSIFAPALVLITSFAPSTIALKASTSSPCAAQCGNELGSTSGSDIVCTNSDYKSAAAGIVFSPCVSCQLASQYVDPVTKQSDLHWAICEFLCKMYSESRQRLLTCQLIDRQLAICHKLVSIWVSRQQECRRHAMYYKVCHYIGFVDGNHDLMYRSTSCGSLESAFEYDSLSVNASSYGFCPLLPAVNVPHCTSCLELQDTESYITNCMFPAHPLLSRVPANLHPQQL